VTYYENNRPRQYYPDFIVITRDARGRERNWIAETKGEIRPNTALKSEAAKAWCEKMSRTVYREWRYLFIPQKEFELSLRGNVTSLEQLSRRLVKQAIN
jgi:hypothetical protein